MLSNQRIRCTNCNFKREAPIYLVELVYSLAGGDMVTTKGSCLGWCEYCQDIHDIETPFELNGVAEQIAQLRTTILSDRWRPSRILGRLFGSSSYAEIELTELTSLLLLSNSRRSDPRCLECGQEGATQLTFDKTGISSVVHACGGQFQRLESPENAIVYSRRPKTYRLDMEGRRMP